MLIVINGECYERRYSWGPDRLVLSAAAFDGLPARGHAILPDQMGNVVSFDYTMTWGNLVYDPASLKSYYRNRGTYPTENHLMRSRRIGKHSRKQRSF